MTEDDINGLITVINQKITPYRSKLVLQFKILMGYIILGILLLGTTAVLLGVIFSYWLSLAAIILYFIGLLIIHKVTATRQSTLEKSVLFNTALVLSNLNFNVLEPKFKVKAKLGHHG